MLPLIINKKKFEEKNFLQNLLGKYNISKASIFEIRPVKEEITINQIRQLKKDLIVSQKEKRLYIFFNFDKSGLETQNSLLKILEEKIEKNLFIFLVDNSEKVISTIKSRAKIITGKPNNVYKRENLLVEKIISLLKKSENLGFLNEKEISLITRENCLDLFDQLIFYFRKEMINTAKDRQLNSVIIKEILKKRALLESNNLNPQLTLDNLLIFIWKTSSMKLQSNIEKK